MHKQLVIAFFITFTTASPNMDGAAAKKNRRISQVVSHVMRAIYRAEGMEQPALQFDEDGDAPTMMEAFLAYQRRYVHHSPRSPWFKKAQKMKEDLFEWLGDPKNIPLLAMLQREQELTKTPWNAPEKAAYCVFYHAYAGQYRALQDFYRCVFEFEQQRRLDDFTPVRFWHDCYANSNIVQFLNGPYFDNKDGYSTGDGGWSGGFDSSPKIAPHLLSVNLSMLGNVLSGSESTARRHRHKYSNAMFDLGPMMRTVVDYYEFDASGLDKIIVTEEDRQAGRNKALGSTLQIFIPYQDVDKIVYLAGENGRPETDDLGFKGFERLERFQDPKDRFQLQITPIINAIRSGTFTERVEGYLKKDQRFSMDHLQARIVLGSDVMLNPHSGVKIFRYDDLTPAKAQENQKIMDGFCRAMFVDWLERLLKLKPGGIKKEALDRIIKDDTPLAKLIQDRGRAEFLLKQLKAGVPFEVIYAEKPKAKL